MGLAAPTGKASPRPQFQRSSQARSSCSIPSANWPLCIQLRPWPSSAEALFPPAATTRWNRRSLAFPSSWGPTMRIFAPSQKTSGTQNAILISPKGELAKVLIVLLCNREAAAKLGERARQVFEQQAGATVRSVEALREILHLPGESHAPRHQAGTAQRPA